MDAIDPPTQPSKIPHNLPGQLTPFVGRSRELAEMGNLLTGPDCRLLTLVGPGGIGKTRLAIQAAGQVLNHFGNGVYFVSLQPVESIDLLASAIADALPVSLSGQQNPQAQLANYLSNKTMLLLLDNFEHLLAGATLLTHLLRASSGVKLLVTSREALNLQEEWLYPVSGLPYPDTEQPDALETASAVQLFINCARRVRPDFSPDHEREGVANICRLVEGTPLALELAASWVKTLTCAEIVAEIRRNLDFLATRLRDVPQRHQSMQAVFDQSWQFLSRPEQAVFKRLAVFRGSFRRHAAERVAGASLTTLTALVDKSLLRWEPEGRYQIHELLRQYAAEQLAHSPEDVAQVYDLHCTYYADLLHGRLAEIISGQEQTAMSEVETELDNVRAAWQWAVAQNNNEAIHKMMQALDMFYQIKGRYLEAAAAFEKAEKGLRQTAPSEQTKRVLLELLVNLAWQYIRLGQLAEAEEKLEHSQALYQELDIPPVPGYATDPRLALGIIATIRGDYERATQLGEQARQSCQAQKHHLNCQTAYYLLARAALLRGQYKAAQQHLEQVYATTQQTGDRWFRAYCLTEMGNVARALKDYSAAREHYQASYALRQEFNDPEGMAAALNALGEVAIYQKNYADAQQLFEQSRAIYQEIGDKGGLATSLNGLAKSAVVLGNYRAARQQFQQALEISVQMQFVPLTLSILQGIGSLLLQVGQPERGLDVLHLAAHHPASEPETKERAQEVLNHYSDSLPAELAAAAGQQNTNLAAAVTRIQTILATPFEAETQQSSPPQPSHAPELVEQLTPRELEVLRCIGRGLTNQQIADELIISVGTVKSHNNSIYGKLGASNRVQALERARELKLL